MHAPSSSYFFLIFIIALQFYVVIKMSVYSCLRYVSPLFVVNGHTDADVSNNNNTEARQDVSVIYYKYVLKNTPKIHVNIIDQCVIGY